MKHRSAVIAGVVAVALAALVALFATSGGSDDDEGGGSVASTLIGEVAPPTAGPTIDGGTFDLDKLRGTWVVVNFFATWCPPCVQEHPELVAFAEAAGGRAEVVSVAFDDQPDKIREFFELNGGDWPVLATDTGPISLDYGVKGLPESFLVDPEGRVVEKIEGGVTAGDLEAAIARAADEGGS